MHVKGFFGNKMPANSPIGNLNGKKPGIKLTLHYGSQSPPLGDQGAFSQFYIPGMIVISLFLMQQYRSGCASGRYFTYKCTCCHWSAPVVFPIPANYRCFRLIWLHNRSDMFSCEIKNSRFYFLIWCRNNAYLGIMDKRVGADWDHHGTFMDWWLYRRFNWLSSCKQQKRLVSVIDSQSLLYGCTFSII